MGDDQSFPDERAELLRQGYRPVEVWVPDFSKRQLPRRSGPQARSSVEADRREGLTDLLGEDAYEDGTKRETQALATW